MRFPLARYYFDVEKNDHVFLDNDGTESLDAEGIRRVAIGMLPVVAANDLPDGDNYHASVRVRDEAGEIVFVADLSMVARWRKKLKHDGNGNGNGNGKAA